MVAQMGEGALHTCVSEGRPDGRRSVDVTGLKDSALALAEGAKYRYSSARLTSRKGRAVEGVTIEMCGTDEVWQAQAVSKVNFARTRTRTMKCGHSSHLSHF